ncbi:hypothetical protein F4679DRAFT_90676 [Xylaria curta]|nr:hypothetical protein F4679DRAFT_90676 [Xylaria curta]
MSAAFRPAAQTMLQEVYDMAVKASHTQEALISFEKHASAETCPPAMNALHAPVCMNSKEFKDSADGTSAIAEIDSLIRTARQSVLAQFIQVKQPTYVSATSDICKTWSQHGPGSHYRSSCKSAHASGMALIVIEETR